MEYLLGIIVLLGVIALIVYLVMYTPSNEIDGYTLLDGSHGATSSLTLSYDIQPSFNEPEGRVYSYEMWILVNDFSYGYGQTRTIMNKGDAPGIYLDSTSNSLKVNVATYGMTESIVIPNIPAMKWIHLAIVVNQSSVDIFINGTLRQHHTLSQLPKLTTDSITLGSGWEGVVGNVKYYPRALTNYEVRQMSEEAPPPDMQPKIGTPNYFDITWYTGRLNSK